MASPESSTATVWSIWLQLYPVYCSLALESAIDVPSCPDLDSSINVPDATSVTQAETWFATMDARILIHHLRHFAQTSPLMTEQVISNLLSHFLSKKHKTAEDRDKVDFLIVQLLAMELPPRVAASDITQESVMKLLEPAIGTGSGAAPSFAPLLEEMIASADGMKNLNEFFTSRIIERNREIKQSCGNEFFQPPALGAFARFGYLIRRRFFQLIQGDLNAILEGLHELDARGVTTIDCRKAQFGAEEPLTRIRMICQSWRVMFQAEYSAGQPLCLLADLKTAVATALAQGSRSKPMLTTKARAAEAGAVQGSRE